MELIDLEGTNLKVRLDKKDWDENAERMKEREGLPYISGTLNIKSLGNMAILKSF